MPVFWSSHCLSQEGISVSQQHSAPTPCHSEWLKARITLIPLGQSEPSLRAILFKPHDPILFKYPGRENWDLLGMERTLALYYICLDLFTSDKLFSIGNLVLWSHHLYNLCISINGLMGKTIDNLICQFFLFVYLSVQSSSQLRTHSHRKENSSLIQTNEFCNFMFTLDPWLKFWN